MIHKTVLKKEDNSADACKNDAQGRKEGATLPLPGSLDFLTFRISALSIPIMSKPGTG